MSLNTGEMLCGMITLTPALCILKLHQRETDSSRNVIVSTKRCQVQMALSCPTTIPVEFSTLVISSGTGIPYYQSINRSKLPACTTKPPNRHLTGPLGCFSWSLLKLWVVFSSRAWQADFTTPTLPAGCQDQPARSPGCSLLTDTVWEVHGNKIQLCT